MIKGKYILLIILFTVTAPLVVSLISDHTRLGSDTRGYVEKDVYAHYGNQNIKIAVVTGIHPREAVSIAPVRWASRIFALLPVEVTSYNIVVEDSPMDYVRGRSNGEGLAADYILPDIKKGDYDIVIIAHAHKPGYGEGFYVATPQMDHDSVKIAEKVRGSGFNYYPVSGKRVYRSSSGTLFSRPLARAGYPTLVYEVPEWSTSTETFFMTLKLLWVSSRELS